MFLAGLAIIFAIAVVLMPNTKVGEIMDKSINYMGVFAIPFILWFWEDKRTKEEKQRREEKETIRLNALVTKYKQAAVNGIEALLTKPCCVNWKEIWPSYFEEGSKNIIFNQDEHSYLYGILINLGLFYHNNFLRTRIIPNTENPAEFQDWLREESQKLQSGAYDQQIKDYLKNNSL